MTLKIPEWENLFKRKTTIESKIERKGDVIVALDGSGDTDSIEESLNLVPNNGKIFLKEGIFKYNKLNTLTIPSNTIIEGAGFGSIIQLGELGTSGNYWISLNNAENIIIKNLTIHVFASADTEAFIEYDSANKITFENVLFKFGDSNLLNIMWDPYGNGITRLKLLNCVIDTTNGSLNEGIVAVSNLSKGEFIGNRFETANLFMTGIGSNIDNCIIRGNYLKGLTLEAGCDNNVVIGNQTDNAIINNGASNQVANNAIF